MHPLLLRRLRPIAAVVLVFFTWFSIEPWNFALAAQDPPTRQLSRPVSAPKPSAAEQFESDLRSIKEKVHSAREGDAYQAQLNNLIEALGQAIAEISREVEASRRAVDRVARVTGEGRASQEAINGLRIQEQSAKAAFGKARLNTAGVEGLLRGMPLPAGLTRDQKEAKEAVASLVKNFDAALAVISKREAQHRGFDWQAYQAFLTASMELDQGFATLRARVEALAREATPERRRAQLWAEAFGRRHSVLLADREIREESAQTEAFLKKKGLPQEILDRHYAAVREYEGNVNRLHEYLRHVDSAQRAYTSATEFGNASTAQTAERDLEAKLSSLADFLDANVKEPPHQPLDPNNLPNRTPTPTQRKPRLKKEEFSEFQRQTRLAYTGDPSKLLLAQASTDIPTPEDLAETIEVQFTPDIQALAAELEHNPVKMYNWVRNNIDFVPTYGSIQGANGCLVSRECNDLDTASLLIALFRVSGISARYAVGTDIATLNDTNNWRPRVTVGRPSLAHLQGRGKSLAELSFEAAEQEQGIELSPLIPLDELVGEGLHQHLLAWWGERDLYVRSMAVQRGIVEAIVPSVGLSATPLSITHLFGVPARGSYRGYLLDIKRVVTAVAHTAGDENAAIAFLTASGFFGSALEGEILTQLHNLNSTGISAASLIAASNSVGTPVFEVSRANLSQILPLLTQQAAVRADVINAVNSGKVVTIPGEEVSVGGYRGTGYIVLDPTTGAGAYLISGGYAGGGAEKKETAVVVAKIPPQSKFLASFIIPAASGAAGTAVKTTTAGELIIELGKPKPDPPPHPPGPGPAGLSRVMIASIITVTVVASIFLTARNAGEGSQVFYYTDAIGRRLWTDDTVLKKINDKHSDLAQTEFESCVNEQVDTRVEIWWEVLKPEGATAIICSLMPAEPGRVIFVVVGQTEDPSETETQTFKIMTAYIPDLDPNDIGGERLLVSWPWVHKKLTEDFIVNLFGNISIDPSKPYTIDPVTGTVQPPWEPGAIP